MLVGESTTVGTTRICWFAVSGSSKNTNGTTVPPQAFMENIQIRVNGTSGGRLYDGGNNDGSRILPSVTNHNPTASVPWTNVSSIQMLFEDTVGNQYVSYWNRAPQRRKPELKLQLTGCVPPWLPRRKL
ncbi:MAG: hypothetical protein ACKODH_08725 [Limisphaerales bacterium]